MIGTRLADRYEIAEEIVMPLLAGVTLRQRIESQDLSPEEAVRIAIEVAEGHGS